MWRVRGLFLLAAACAALAVLGSGQALAVKGKKPRGKVAVTIVTPRGVPANVLLKGRSRRVAAKPAKGKRARMRLSLPARRYKVRARPVSFRGRFYVGVRSRRKVRVIRGKTTRLRVRYRRVRSASGLRPKKIGSSRLALTWKGPKGASFALRRAVGSKAPRSRKGGKRVRTRGRSALDVGLRPGRRYSYALFTKVRRRWTGPIELSAATTPRPRSRAAAFITSPGTVLAKPGQVSAARPTGAGVALRLKGKDGPPVIGTIVVLPPSARLPGGFLGRVRAVNANGTLSLTAASLDEAFDFYRLNIREFQDAPTALRPADAAPASSSRARHGMSSALKTCLGGGGASRTITLKPSVGLGGHLRVAIDKYSILGKEIPKGASLDMKLTATAKAAMDAKVNASFNCSAPFPKIVRLLTVSPVPISFVFSPVASVSVSGGAEVANAGVTATAGFHVAGSFGVTDGFKAHGGPIFSGTQLEAKGTAVKGSVDAKLGGEVIVGPGAGTPGAGVIAGVGGKFTPVDAKISAVFPLGDSRHGACVETSAEFTRELNLTAKAWLSGWSVSDTVTLDFLKGRTPYGGSPWYWPVDCTQLPADDPPEPGDNVVGEGVSVVDDSTTGSPDQVGRVDGFVPGSASWVLSTGRIDDAVGPPDSFASTDMGMPGDTDLTALAGWPTYDAASYRATLVPDGDTLHVKYVFASEEYPEYVGSEYNDVMQVLIDGHNCALVPGTSSPVSVNTVNHETNSAYHVDNTVGAPGYSTAMDGLTVPLTCDAAVTPGQPVTVKIAVADTSDSVYDSAVALVDQGIWSD